MLKLHPRLLSGQLVLAILLLGSATHAQYKFDLITYDRYEVNEQTFRWSDSWAIIVNTGTVPIPITEWVKAKNFATLDTVVGDLILKTNNPGRSSIPVGAAIGSSNGPLLSRLGSGGNFTTAMVLNFQVGSPFPMGTTQKLKWTFVLGDQQVSGTTDLVFTSTPGPGTARRYRSRSTTTVAEPYGSGCAGSLDSNTTSATSASSTVSSSSDLPVIGNHRFGIRAFGLTGPGLLCFDLTPGSFNFLGPDCTVLLGLSSSFVAVPAAISTPLPIPNDPRFVGVTLFAQALSMNTTTGVWTSTDALRLLIGSI